MKEYENHPYADVYPLCPEEQLQELAADIKEHGLHHPVTLYQDKILDGRHRYLACKIAEVEATFKTFEGTDEQAFHFALSENIKRRNTTASQRAASAVLAEPLCKWFSEEAKKRQGKRTDIKAKLPEGSNGQARDQLGKLFNIGGRYVSDAKALSELPEELDELLTRKENEWRVLAEQHAGLRTIIASLHSGAIEMAEAKRMKDAFSHGKLLVETELAKRKKPELILADPPWKYDDGPIEPGRTVDNHYDVADVATIVSHCPRSADDAILLLWATAALLPEAMLVMKEWGFSYKTNSVWDKQKIGIGYWFRGQHELLLVGVKGNAKPPPEVARVSSVFSEVRTTHSKKPECVYKWIENAFPALEKLEMYARTKREGWKQWGNEV
jgi:N6-adenosine-specific RNA methylase IME4